MNYELFEKALARPLMISVTELSFNKNKNEDVGSGLLYTIFNKEKGIINIGFTYEINRLEFNSTKIHFKRLGSIREEKIIKETLKELGHFPRTGNDTYNYSNNLIKHLRIMGWPVGPESSKKIKKQSRLDNDFSLY